jgi:hypothetical protein
MPIEDLNQTIEELLAEAVHDTAEAESTVGAGAAPEAAKVLRRARRRSDRQTRSKEQLAEISRNNGSHSHGPTSEEGKRASSANAMTHGLTANILLTEEDPVEFARLFQIFFDQFQPATPAEERIVRNIALAEYRFDRAVLMQTNLMDFETDTRTRKLLVEFPALDQAGLLAVSFREAHRESSALDLMRRYEVAHERSTARNIRLLLQLQQARLKQKDNSSHHSEPAPEPSAENVSNFETNPVRHTSNVIPITTIDQEEPPKAA